MTPFDYELAVVGAGMMGASLARHAGALHETVALIGPDEPQDPTAFQDPFGAHHDQARITRILSSDAITAELAKRSLAHWPEIEAVAGDSFYSASGVLLVADRCHSDYLGKLRQQATELGQPTTDLDLARLLQNHPEFAFDSSVFFGALAEPAPAGHFNPRLFVAAQKELAALNGVQRIPLSVQVIKPDAGGYLIECAGQQLSARRVVVTAGAYSNSRQLLPHALALRLKPEVVIYAELDQAGSERFKRMPALIYENDNPLAGDLYLLPPVRYRDGRVYIKMGANTMTDRYISGEPALNDWYRSGDSDRELDSLRQVLQALMPGLDAVSWHTRRCAITRTFHEQPYIDRVDDNGWYVAVGGNGHSAKTADAIGRLAAGYIENGIWSDSLDPSTFRAVLASEAVEWPSNTLFSEQRA